MKIKNTFLFFRYILALLVFIVTAMYCIVHFGLGSGIHMLLLVWSLYVLCLPAAHGQLLIGYPIYSLFQRCLYIEPFIWLMAVGINIGTYFFAQEAYKKLLLSQFLYRIISIVNPYWIIIFVAFIGTFYNVITHQHCFSRKAFNHTFMKVLLFFLGFFIFLFFSYSDFVLLLNAFV